MANPPNQSGGGPQNGVDYEDLLHRAKRTTIQQREDQKRISELGSDINAFAELAEIGVSPAMEDIIRRATAKNVKRMNVLNERVDIRGQAQTERISDLTQNQLAAAFSSRSVNGQSMAYSRSSAGVYAGLAMVSEPWRDLERTKSAAQNMVATLGKRAQAVGAELHDSSGIEQQRKVDELRMLESRKNFYVNRVGASEAAMRQQRANGTDPESRIEYAAKLAGRAQAQINETAVGQEISQTGGVKVGGQFINAGADAMAALPAKTAAVVAAFEALTAEAKKGTKDLTSFQEAVEKAAAEQDKVATAAAAGGGGATGAQRLMAAAGGFQALAQGAQTLLVDQRLQGVANTTGLANIANQKYADYKAAAAGSIAAYGQLQAYGGAEDFGNELAVGAGIANTAKIAGGVAQAAGGYAQATEGGVKVFNPFAAGATTEALQGGQNVVGGGAIAATGTMDAARHLSTTSARIQGVNADMGAAMALNKIPAEQKQAFMDFSWGLGATARGMGGAGAGFINRSMEFAKSGPNGSALMGARLSGEEFNKMAGMGVNSMGSTFNEQQIITARGLERSGFGTKEENMQRMGALASAGSNNPQAALGSVLEAAVSKGMDSSKAVSQLVDHSAAMAATSVGRAAGIDTAGASAAMIMAMVGPNTVNKEAAEARAAGLQGNIKDITTNRDVSFTGMVNVSRIQKMTGLGGVEAISAAGIDPATLKAMQKKSAGEQVAFFEARGIDVSQRGAGALTNKLIDASAISLVQGRQGAALGVDADTIAAKIKAGRPLSHSERLSLGRSAGMPNSGFELGTDISGGTAGLYAEPTTAGKRIAGAAMAGKGGSKEQQALDDQLTLSAKQSAAAMAAATSSFTTAKGAFVELSKMAKNIEKMIDSRHEIRSSTDAAKSAESFGAGALKIETAGENMLKAAELLTGLTSTTRAVNETKKAIENTMFNSKPTVKGGSNPRGQPSHGYN